MKVLKKKIHFQNLILRSGYSRRVMSPFGVVQFAIHLIMCSFLHWDFFFFYLVQSHFVVFQPLPSHILCLWLSLDFSQTDKLISFIHTWSFFSFITTSWFFLFFPPDILLPFQLAGHRAPLYENSLDLKGRSEVALGGGWRMSRRRRRRRWWWWRGSASPRVRLSLVFCLSLWEPGISAWHPISC